MLDGLRRVLEEDEDVAYALVFGSAARAKLRPDSDVDIAVELRPGARNDAEALGGLAARLESAARRPVDIVLLEEASAPLAYRIFRDGRLLIVRDAGAMVSRKTEAIVRYLDFKPVEQRCAAGVLRAAATHGR